MVDSARRLLGVEPQPRTWMDSLEDQCCWFCPALTWQQRLFGCLMCFVVGVCGGGTVCRLSNGLVDCLDMHGSTGPDDIID